VAPASLLWATAPFDLRQHLVDDGIFRKRLPEGRIQALQQVGDRFIVPAYEGDANFLPSAARVARRMGGISPIVI